ncbi:uncharacterized protein L969DRAFT_86364 [Mixia osmundae IAM 14324]|uniref:uncharacterized protein n=1 Tax=Mixia osmundae (strain CBS 9802 / IAM 14324 / JCM 22182 / KY 12970) TaxID=764103 RepID=UPI0004A54AE9|nr:uncharacterized protein L969DRAFT_86364 [Mixia osmundae IAM 14324]KEI41118.1 hypothetical protein L969DRAFT_86364 [Mixia osmundae IAM 14324]
MQDPPDAMITLHDYVQFITTTAACAWMTKRSDLRLPCTLRTQYVPARPFKIGPRDNSNIFAARRLSALPKACIGRRSAFGKNSTSVGYLWGSGSRIVRGFTTNSDRQSLYMTVAYTIILIIWTSWHERHGCRQADPHINTMVHAVAVSLPSEFTMLSSEVISRARQTFASDQSPDSNRLDASLGCIMVACRLYHIESD